MVIPAAAASAIATVGSSIISGIFGRKSQAKSDSKALRQNLDIYEASERNTNQRLAKEQKFNRQQADRAYARSKRDTELQYRRSLQAEQRSRKYSDADYQRQLRDTIRMDNTKIQRLAADAAKAGIHPLAALGVSSVFQAPVAAGGSTAQSGVPDSPAAQSSAPGGVAPPYVDRVASSGGLGDIILDGLNAWNNHQAQVQQAELQAAELEVLKSEAARNRAMGAASILDARSRTVASSARAGAQGATTGAQALQRTATADLYRPKAAGGSVDYPGHEQTKAPVEEIPMWVPYVDNKGRKHWALNPDLMDSAVNAAMVGGQAWRNWADGRRKASPNPNSKAPGERKSGGRYYGYQ